MEMEIRADSAARGDSANITVIIADACAPVTKTRRSARRIG